jgi:hypothetical protein
VPGDLARFFADADIFYPASVAPYRTWGAMGMRLWNRFNATASARLDDAGYLEIRLPSICEALPLEKYLGNKADRLVEIAAYPGRNRLALAPFADLQFVEHISALVKRSAGISRIPDKVYQWSRPILAETHGGFLDFGEYLKCEVFSLHRRRRQALEAWERLNGVLHSLCADDLNLDVICGLRPRRTAFPLTARTFAAELTQARDGFQTAVVSHVMAPAFMPANGFVDVANAVLNSACFSQKLLAGVLLHHRDANGLCIPPALAPTLGVLVGAIAARLPGLHDRSVADRYRLCFRPDQPDPVRALVDAGAIWSLAAGTDDFGRTSWLLYRRGEIDASPQTFESLDTALKVADEYVEAFGRQLGTRSRERTQVALREAMVGEDTSSGDRIVPCCRLECCEAELANTNPGLPKIRCRLRYELPCATCAKATSWFLLFERKERYTSFYLPCGHSERANQGGRGCNNAFA